MDKKQIILGMIFASLLGGMVALGGFKLFEKEQPRYDSFQTNQNVKFSSFLADSSFTVPAGLNFVYAAEHTTPTVVHIKSTYGQPKVNEGPHGGPIDDWMKDFFGDPRRYHGQPRPPQQAAGSGVIISSDGYIITNNHVIKNADKLEVTLNDNRIFEAEVIGADPNTDIALVKINAEGLPFIKYGDSDKMRIGEWVLAVGNPFDLTSTVTAGIISAKGRSIGILRERYGIESFIQTDAAVNPGNSGGALVNLRGELIGINTAIATPTGTYAGYSFAVPVSIVQKVINDLTEYGVVQRALLGIQIVNVNDPRLEEEVDDLVGVYVVEVNENSAAEEAGLQKGDVIIKIEGHEVTNTAELQDLVARNRPGDKIKVTFHRDGKTQTVTAKLKNLDNEVRIVRKNDAVIIEGASFKNATKEDLEKLDLSYGVKVVDVKSGKWYDTGIKKGFVISSIDKRPVRNVDDLREMLRTSKGDGILIAGKYPDGEEAYYGMGW